MKVRFAYRLMNCVEEKSEEDFTSKMYKRQTTTKKQEFPMFPLNFRKYLKTVQMKNCKTVTSPVCFHKITFSARWLLAVIVLRWPPLTPVNGTTETPTTSCWDVLRCISDIHGQYVDDKTLGMKDKTLACHWIWKFNLKCLVLPYTNKVAKVVFKVTQCIHAYSLN